MAVAGVVAIRGRPGAAFAAAAAVVALATDVLYLVIIRSQGEQDPGEWVTVAVVALVILGLACCAGAAAVATRPATRKVLLAVAAVGLLVLGVLAIFSIGLLLLLAGLLSVVAWVRVAATTGRT
jgi:hypothetical protein